MMDKPYKETAVAVVPKEQLIFLKHEEQDNGYTDFLVKQLSSQLAERIIQVLSHEGEIVASLSDLRVKEDKTINGVEYRRQIEWSPLVRCKDCKHFIKIFPQHGATYFECEELCGRDGEGFGVDGSFFCGYGKRRDDEIH